jgi:hypothetical protein
VKDRFAALANAYRMTAEVDPRLNLYLGLAFGLPLLAGLVTALVTGGWLLWMPSAVLLALLLALLVFGRRVQGAQFQQIEGMPGAAAAVLQNMRGQWFVVPAVAVNKQQEMVHRVVGRCGVVLVAEGGTGQRVKALVAQARKRLNRVTGDVPVHVMFTGDGEGDTVELSRLQVELTKLPNSLSKTEVPKLARKLAPLDKGNIPMPKGAIPRGGRQR